MNVTGKLRKMASELAAPIQYYLRLDDAQYHLNDYIGQNVQMRFTGHIFCIHCDRPSKKSFNQGYCFPCFRKLAQCDTCIVKPEQCHFDQGTCREPEWAQAHCMQDHIVYLANSSGIKVGITRHTQIPTRWIDQGAIQALPIARVNNRYISGLFEVACKDFVADKTNWRTMLKGQVEAVDLANARDTIFAQIDSKLAAIAQAQPQASVTCLENEPEVTLTYPILSYPEKITSLNLDKNPSFSATLQGIKGQYWLTSAGVINLRKYAGYEIEVTLGQ